MEVILLLLGCCELFFNFKRIGVRFNDKGMFLGLGLMFFLLYDFSF